MLEARFWRAIERVHGLGPRVLGELLAEIGATHLLRSDIEARLERYAARLDPHVLRRLGADRPPPQALHAVSR